MTVGELKATLAQFNDDLEVDIGVMVKTDWDHQYSIIRSAAEPYKFCSNAIILWGEDDK